MNGFWAFFKKELREIIHTQRLWVLPGILVFVAIFAPLLAELTPLIVKSAAGGQPSVVVQVAEPTVLDAYRQLMQQLGQLALAAVIIATAGAVSGEVRSGVALLVLTKPVSRSAFVLAKAAAQTALVAAATLLGGAVFVGITRVLFGEVDAGAVLSALALWTALATFFIALMVLLSTRLHSQAAASGVGLAAFVTFMVLGTWQPLKDYSPAGLMAAAGRVLEGQPAEALWPVLAAVTAVAAVLALAVTSFRRLEI